MQIFEAHNIYIYKNSTIFDICQIALGTVPFRLLLAIETYVSSFIALITEGIAPVKQLDCIDRYFKRVSNATALGICPINLFLAIFK